MYLSQPILKKVNMMLVVSLLISTNLITSFGATSTTKDDTMTNSEEEMIEEVIINQGASVYNHAYQENYNTDRLDAILQEAVNAYVLLEPDEVTAEDIVKLKANGNAVSAYMNIGTAEKWRDDFDALKPYVAQNEWAEWKNEYFIQVVRPQVIYAMEDRIDRIAEMGFEWIEFDNMDFAFDELNAIRYGIFVTEEEAIKYFNKLYDYAHEKGLKVMAKNTIQGAEKFDGVTYESYEDNFNWWKRDDLKAFLAEGKIGIIVHYGDDNPPQTYLNYKGEYGEELSIIIESMYLMKYVHY